jgi:hypothetical protein
VDIGKCAGGGSITAWRRCGKGLSMTMHDILVNAQFESSHCIGNLIIKQEGMFMLVTETDNMRNTKKHVDDSVVSKIITLDQKYDIFTCNCVQS